MARNLGASLLAVVVLLSAACGNDGTGLSTAEWSLRAPLPVPRVEHQVVVVGNKAYALGGFSGSTLARVDEYDPATDTWTRKADMPTARRRFAAGVINGRIYVSAGMSFSDPNGVTYLTATEEYDPATDSWTSRAPCPLDPATNSVLGNVAITGGAANGRLYVMVFNTNIPGFTETYEYDPATDAWTTKSPPPFSYAQYAIGGVGSVLYLLASESGPNGRVAEYHAADDTWIVRAAVPGRWWAGLGGTDGTLYAIGGAAVNSNGTPTGVVGVVSQYDPASDRWIQRGSLGVPRHSAAVVSIGGVLYVIGGASTTDAYVPTPTAVVEAGELSAP